MTYIKFLFLFQFLLISLVSHSQTSKFYYSDVQVDKTPSGAVVHSYHSASIKLTDPKGITAANARFEDLPIGKMTIKYDALSSTENMSIKYFGNFQKDKDIDWYGVTHTTLDNNTVLIVRINEVIRGKTYHFKIVIASMNESGAMLNYTAYYCN